MRSNKPSKPELNISRIFRLAFNSVVQIYSLIELSRILNNFHFSINKTIYLFFNSILLLNHLHRILLHNFQSFLLSFSVLHFLAYFCKILKFSIFLASNIFLSFCWYILFVNLSIYQSISECPIFHLAASQPLFLTKHPNLHNIGGGEGGGAVWQEWWGWTKKVL